MGKSGNDAIERSMSLAAKKTTTATTPRVATKKRVSKAKESQTRELALAIAQAALDKKALDVEIIDVTGKVDYADFVVVMSATSDRQANAIAKNIDTELSRAGSRAMSIEGLPQGAWVLMDYGDVVVHIFHEDTRGYYDLEALWSDAERVEVVDQKRA
jgi:ribosome-associated protein